MNGTATHYLSKDEVIQRLQSVHYSFQESYWDAFLESQNNNKYAMPKAPSIKFSPKLLAIPLSLIIVSAILYFSITNLRSQNKSSAPLDQQQEATILPAAPSKTEPPVPIENKKPDPVVSTPVTEIKKEPLPEKKEQTKKEEPAVTKKSDSEENTSAVANTAKTIKPEASVSEEKKESTSKKKKKKRRREKSSESNTLVPSPEDDNVIVPEN